MLTRSVNIVRIQSEYSTQPENIFPSIIMTLQTHRGNFLKTQKKFPFQEISYLSSNPTKTVEFEYQEILQELSQSLKDRFRNTCSRSKTVNFDTKY